MRWWPRNCGRARTNRECKRNWRPRKLKSRRLSKPSTSLARRWRSSLALDSQSNVSGGKLVEQLPAERAGAAAGDCGESAGAGAERRDRAGAIATQGARAERTIRSSSVQGLAAARGTGMLTNGARLGGLNGLAPTTQNYGLGLTVTFPVMDRFAIREQEAMQSANIRAGQAQYQVIATNLQAQFNAALATLNGARRVAANTPVEVSSARAALQQATARYQSGLAPIDDVAQAQRLLVQAQIDDALARLNVWRATTAS